MRYAEGRSKTKQKHLGDVTRSLRNKWIEENEDKAIAKAPYPISFDVGCTQDAGFSEYSYTEYLTGIYLKTQSQEINLRIMEEAAKVESAVDWLKEISIQDKYNQEAIDIKSLPIAPKGLIVAPGSNILQIMSKEAVAKAIFYDDELAIKFHPLTNEEDVRKYASMVGWNKVIPPTVSLTPLLHQVDTIYGTAASEVVGTAVVLKKTIKDITNFLLCSRGAYLAINSTLFQLPKEEQYKALNNIVGCKWSGVIMPFHENFDERVESFFDKSLELRKIYKPRTPQFVQGMQDVIK